MRKDVNASFTGSVRLLHRRWSVPVIGVLYRTGPQRFSALAAHLPNASRDTLTATLQDLQMGGIIRHAGDSYELTAAGALTGDAALGAVAVVRDLGIRAIALKKWPMMVLVAIGRGSHRFNDVKAVLPGLTSGALAPALKDLEAAGLVARSVSDGYPPTVSYRLTSSGEALFPAMDHMVRAAQAAFDEAGSVPFDSQAT
ncbi:MAG: helix-turn-helix transcriptional regulator [Thermomicrobiales bacterium]|nr:helix-turn-helix transcriptional regulator [Thermomicrobiales bacterium]